MDRYSFFIVGSTFSSLHVSADSTSASDYGIASDRNTNTSNDVSSSSESVWDSSLVGSGSQSESTIESNESIQQDQTEQNDKETDETTDSREDQSTIQFNGENGDWRVGSEDSTTEENVYNSFIPDGSSWDIPLENETEEDTSFSSFMQPMMLMARAAGVNLTKPPRSDSSYPGGYYINGYYEGMKIPLPSNLNNMAIIIELIIMQTRDSVQNLYYGLASVNNQVNKNRDVADQNNVDRFNENVRAIANAASAQSTADSAKASISGLQSSNQDRFNEIAALASRMTSAENSNKDRVKDISNLQTSINKNVNAISAIQSSLDTRVKEITALQSSNKDRAAETGSLSNRATSLESAMKDRVTEINGLKSSNTDRAKETGSLSNRATSLESAMKDRVNEIATLVQNNKDRLAEITSLQTSNGDRAKETASLTNRASSLESAMKDRVSEINAQSKEINALKARNTPKNVPDNDLNNVKDAGYYVFGNTAINGPVSGYGTLEVIKFMPYTSDTSTNLFVQKVVLQASSIEYVRSYHAQHGWSNWERTATHTDLASYAKSTLVSANSYTDNKISVVNSSIENQVKEINALKARNTPKNVPDNDLNNVKQAGYYVFGNTVVNAPAKFYGTLEVVKFMPYSDDPNATLFVQKIRQQTYPTEYVRTYHFEHGWSNWEKTATATDLASYAKSTLADAYSYTDSKAKETLSSAGTYTDSKISVLTKDISTLVQNNLDRVKEITSLNTWKTVQLAWNTTQELRITGQQTSIDNQVKEINALKARNTPKPVPDNDLNNVKQSGYYTFGNTAVNAPSKNYGTLEVVKFMPYTDDPNATLFVQRVVLQASSVEYIRSYHFEHGWSNWEKTATITDLASYAKSTLASANTYTDSKAKETLASAGTYTDSKYNQLSSVDSSQQSAINTLTAFQTSQLLINNTTSSDISSLNTRMTKFEGTDWTSVFNSAGIIHAIDVVRDKILVLISSLDNLSVANNNGFSGVNSNLKDLKFVFSDYDKGAFWVNLRSHLAIQKVLFDEGINQIDNTLVLILKGINSIGDSLNTVNNWLELLTMKPSDWSPEDTSKLPPFWNAGGSGGGGGWAGIIKEAIKLVGSVIKTAIETLGDLLGKGIDGIFGSVGDILDFLNSLIDKIIALIVPENMDFMTDTFDNINVKFKLKFGSVLGLADMFKNAFTPAAADFESSVSFNLLGVEFKPEFGLINGLVSKARVVMALMIWLNVAWYIFKRLTGSGDLINDN